MEVAVFGPGHHRGEKYRNYDHVCSILDPYEGITKIVSGGGVGVERLATRYAQDSSLEVEVIPPNIQALGTVDAFIARNAMIIKKVKIVILLWDGRDPKYHRLLADAVAAKVPVHIYHVE